MRENLLDIVERLMSIRYSLGEEAFRQACHRARLSMATVALEHAEGAAKRRSRSVSSSKSASPSETER